ncbi:MAG: ABC transporter permease subunit [Deltaproteobacteria bacterium]|nr:ABC transporter permease subunit [Deltaproteobacteria bacterium]
MSRQLRSYWAVARLDFAEVLRSRWLLFCVVVYAVLAGVFLLVGMRESTVFGFTGTGRVLVSYVHALLVLLPLMALIATGQVVNKARDDGTLEILFSQPISRGAYFSAISSVRFLVLLAPLAVLMVAVGIFGRFAFDQQIAWSFIGHCLVLCSVLIWSFCGLGLWVSTTVQNSARATMYLLLIWVAAIAFMDFAPVGFYLANEIGSMGLYVLGVAWPMLLGTLAWMSGLWKLRRGDVV